MTGDFMVPAGDCTVPRWGLHVHVRTRSVIFQLSPAPWSALGPWNLVRIPTGERLLHWGLAREIAFYISLGSFRFGCFQNF